MIIKSVHIKNFCGLLDVTLHCDSLTALVGGNGCGKSTFLRALDLFYASSPRITASDFYNDDSSSPIEITISFTGLSPAASELFASFLEGDTLAVTRVLALADGKQTTKYHGVRLQHPEFMAVRKATSKTDIKARYDDLCTLTAFSELPSVRSAEQALTALEEFEQNHPESCEWIPDDGSFFGFGGVGKGYLGRFTRFLLIPAVRDASDDGAEGRGSPFTEILDLNLRGTLAGRPEVKEFQQEVSQRYRELMDPIATTALAQLEAGLNEGMQSLVPDGGVELTRDDVIDFNLPMPLATAKLREHGYATPVTNAGHGLQRAFILTMLQTLADAKAKLSSTLRESDEEDVGPELPDLVLAIEEPELYQHPNRQRHFAKILYELANDPFPGVAQRTQVIYTTHSPHFVGIDRYEHARICHKVDGSLDMPRVTRVVQVTGDQVSRTLLNVKPGAKERSGVTWDTLQPSLHRVMTPIMNEGFFADVVVLVEGDEDRAAILATAELMEVELDAHGISIIPCYGKNNLPKPFVIFTHFGIKTFVIWDGDVDNQSEASMNRQLQKLLGVTPDDFPDTQVAINFACFKSTLQGVSSVEVGEDVYSEIMEGQIKTLGLKGRKEANKNPVAVAQCIEELYGRGLQCPTLESIVNQIMAIRIGACVAA